MQQHDWFSTSPREHVTHWLPVVAHIKFMILVLAYSRRLCIVLPPLALTSLHALQEPAIGTWPASPGISQKGTKLFSQMFLITVGMIFPTLSGQNPWQYSRNSWKFKTHLFHEQLTASCWKTSISFAIPWSLPVPACTSNTKFQTSLTIALLVFVASFRWIAYRILHL